MSDKYKNGKIYTIRCKNDDSLIYVGSTVQPLFKRWYEHKTRLNNEKCNNFLLYKKIRETNIGDWYIELYEDCSCESKEQLNKREGQIIREIGTLNKKISGRTKKEYIEDNKDKILQNKKEYYEANKDTMLQKQKDWNEANKDKIKEYKKIYNREYQQNNKNKINEYMQEYRLKKKNLNKHNK